MLTDIEMTPYEEIGGETTVRKLIEAFYTRVEKDTLLKPLFPSDFTEIKQKQMAFITQFFGGPMLYTKTYGAPMLRLRHQPFPITTKHRDAWLKCMDEAMTEIGLSGPLRNYLFQRLTGTAHHMVNTTDEEIEFGG